MAVWWTLCEFLKEGGMLVETLESTIEYLRVTGQLMLLDCDMVVPMGCSLAGKLACMLGQGWIRDREFSGVPPPARAYPPKSRAYPRHLFINTPFHGKFAIIWQLCYAIHATFWPKYDIKTSKFQKIRLRRAIIHITHAILYFALVIFNRDTFDTQGWKHLSWKFKKVHQISFT